MRSLLRVLSWVGLALSLVPACLFFYGQLGSGAVKGLMLAGTVLWFAAVIPLDRFPAKRRK